MRTLTLFAAYEKANAQLIDVLTAIAGGNGQQGRELRVMIVTGRRLQRQCDTFAVAIRARLESTTRYIELSEHAQECLQRYADAHSIAAIKAINNDPQARVWREDCRSYAAAFASAALFCNTRIREVKA